jgi:putative transposase
MVRSRMSRPRRIPGYSYTGVQRYFLTLCTKNRAEHFIHADIVAVVLAQFFHTAREQAVSIVAYCVMPDHAHLLIDGDSDAADLTQFVRLAKQQSGYLFKQKHGRLLWQEGYFEHVLRDAERNEDVIFYIVANPLRKGLVKNVMDYPFWGSGLYSREELLAHIGIRRTR